MKSGDTLTSAPLPIDPRRGDLEDDASSTAGRSLLSMAGNLLVEISLPRLVTAWISLLVIPGLLLGAAPIAASIWVAKTAGKITTAYAGIGSLAVLAILLAGAWFGWRPLFRVAERSFWSLSALIVQPVYATVRELLRHVAESFLPRDASALRRARLRGASAAVSGILVSGVAALTVVWVWPDTHMLGGIPALGSVWQLGIVVLSNSTALVAGYLAVSALIWAATDAVMPQPRDLSRFHPRPSHERTWRVAHLSDIHVVGERYGFRIESGRSGPQGNGRWRQVLARLATIHAINPLDLVLITGDMTDAGRSTEWAEFLDALAVHPRLAALTLMLPGNHDINIVDRANPARLDLPTSPKPRLRQVRMLAALAAVQGERVRAIDFDKGRVGPTLNEVLAPHLRAMAGFAATGSPHLLRTMPELWNAVFPMVLPPVDANGLGVLLLNSNATTHFSFTNALGMISAEQARGIEIALSCFPQARWIVALHHHVLEYPRAAKALAERIGTALINGNWFVRRLRPFAGRLVVMHGHRHIDWIGECEGVIIASAPSPVMGATNDMPTHFYVHTLVATSGGRIGMMSPDMVTVGGSEASDEASAQAAPAPPRVPR